MLPILSGRNNHRAAYCCLFGLYMKGMIIWQRRDAIIEELYWKKENHRTAPDDTATDIMMIKDILTMPTHGD